MKIKGLYQYVGVILGLFTVFSFISCESDDLCDQDILTPRLIIRFYNKESQKKLLPVEKLLVVGAGQTKALYPISTTDSLVLPLKTLSESTTYRLVKDAVVSPKGEISGDAVELIINYNPEQVFASKACGYKVIFTKLGVSLGVNSSWISLFQIKKNQIKNEKEAHLYIYH